MELSEKMSIFISQPMAWKSETEIKYERAWIEEILKKKYKNAEFIDSYTEEEPPEGVNAGLWYLGKSIMSLSQADAVYFDKGWKDYKGCVIEHECALKYGIPIIKD